MTAATPIALEDIPRTLYIPLFYRAQESSSRDPLVHDPDAERLLDEAKLDLSKLAVGFGNRMSRAGTVNRTLLIDDSVERFMKAHPGGTVLNVGCGLDARFRRLDDGRVHWIDLDLPQVIALRRRSFPDEHPSRYRVVEGSILEEDWISEVRADSPLMILCEGTLMYFVESEVQTFVERCMERLAPERLCLEVSGPWLANRVHPSVRAIGLDALPLRWGTRDFEAMAAWHPSLSLDRARTVFDINLGRFGAGAWIARLIPGFKTGMGSTIVDLAASPSA